MEEENQDDIHERPTTPGEPPDSLRFETPYEAFFASAPPPAMTANAVATLALITSDDDDFVAWWASQRRRVYASWVAGVMALCFAVLVAGAMR